MYCLVFISQEEPTYWPVSEGQTVKSGRISVTNVKTREWDDGAGHFSDEVKVTEIVLLCKDGGDVS